MTIGRNPYKITQWLPHIIEVDEKGNPVIDPETGRPVIISEGTRFTSERAMNIENAIYRLFDEVIEREKADQRHDIKFLLMDRSSSSNVFYDALDGTEGSKITMDVTNSEILAAQIAGATVLPVNSVEGFKTFTEVTVYDDTNQEDTMITAIDPEAKTITVGALVNAYKKGAKIARSNVTIEPIAQEMQAGEWGTFTIETGEVI